MVALTEFKGEADPTKISEALQAIKAAIKTERPRGKTLQIKKADAWGSLKDYVNDNCEAIGFRLSSVKACFNKEGEPSIAVYEMQYNNQKTQVFLEVDEE